VLFSTGTISSKSPPWADTLMMPPSPVLRTMRPSGHHEALLPPESCMRMSAMAVLSPPPAGAFHNLPAAA